MHIERQVGDFPKGTNDWRTEGQVRNEVSIHDVDVQPLSATGDDAFHFLPEASQVGAQDARCNDNAHGETASSLPPAVESTVPTRTPAAVRICLASGTLSPITSGTATSVGPVLTTSWITVLGLSTVPGGGSCQITAPAGKASLGRSPSMRGRKPSSFSFCRALDSGISSTRGSEWFLLNMDPGVSQK